MANMFRSLFGGTAAKKSQNGESRYGLNDVHEWIKAAGGTFISGGSSLSGKTEPIGNNFESYVSLAYQQNGIVFACAVARMLIFSEARFAWQKRENGKFGDLFWDQGLTLLEEPWPMGQTDSLLTRAMQDADNAGNHYVVSEGVGEGKRLRWLRPDWVHIILTAPPSEATKSDIAGHIYKPGNTQDPDKWEVYPIDGSNGRVAHWAPIPDPVAQYRGMSWMTPVLREIMADKSITTHKGKFFENAATPTIAVSLKESVTPTQFEDFKEKFQSVIGGVENAYKPLYLGGGADVTVVGADLAQMDFRTVQGGGETRIAAAARVHPVLVGLSEGMQGSSLNAGNYVVAKRSFADGTLRPLWRSLCGAYANLLPKDPLRRRLWIDVSDIAFLRDDAKDVAEIQKVQSSTITQYTREGFTWESAIACVVSDDPRLLKHTGLYSVQLRQPGADADPSTPDKGGTNKDPAKNADKEEGDKDA